MKRASILYTILGLGLLLFSAVIPYISTISARSESQSTPVTVFYVSPNGSDDNGGMSASAPFHTIRRAIAAVRSYIRGGMQSDVTVMLRGGTYYLNQSLDFGPQDSGVNGYKIIYTSYPGENAVIVGGQPVTGWEQYRGSVYRAYVGTSWKFYTLFENGVRSTLARWPTTGYITVSQAVPSYNTTRFVYRAGDLPASFDYSSATVYIWPGQDYDTMSEIIPIKNVNFANRTITLNSSAVNSIESNPYWYGGSGNRYFLQDSKDFLTAPGEFYLDNWGYLYYWPRATPIAQQQIIAPTVQRIVDLEGNNGSNLSYVHDIVFEDLTFEISDFAHQAMYSTNPNLVGTEAAIYMATAANITVRFSTIENSGSNGVAVFGMDQNYQFYGNLIEDSGSECVNLLDWPNIAHPYGGGLVSNNLIRRCGQLLGGLESGDGVFFYGDDHVVSHNVITDVPAMGITFGNEYQPVVNNLVEFNDVSHFLTDSQDGGGIYASGTGKNNTISSNVVHDAVSGAAGGITGIYLDDHSNYVKVENNIVYGIGGPWANPVTLKALNQSFINNIVINMGSLEDVSTRSQFSQNDYMTIARNIFYGTLNGNNDIYRFYDWDQDKIAVSDNNTFFDVSGLYTVAFGSELGTGGGQRINLTKWQTTYGFDKHSITANPLFVDQAHNNYTLSPSSPALRLRFVNIDTSKVGLPSGSPFLNWPATSRFPVSSGALTLLVTILSNSTIERFSFSQANHQAGFYVDGRDGTQGFTRVSIPKGLFNGQLGVLVDGVSHAFVQSSNSTYDTLTLAYSHSMHQVTIETSSVSSSTSATANASTSVTTAAASTSTTSGSISTSAMTSSGGIGGIPRFSFQALALVLFTVLLIVSYLAARHRRTAFGR